MYIYIYIHVYVYIYIYLYTIESFIFDSIEISIQLNWNCSILYFIYPLYKYYLSDFKLSCGVNSHSTCFGHNLFYIYIYIKYLCTYICKYISI